MKLSMLDVVPVSIGATPAEAINRSVEVAQLGDRLGYHRYWVAEHHGSPNFASAAPEILIGRIASETRHIRVGSGAVLLPYYSPLKVVEVFHTLATMYPGRIDLGIGRGQGAEPPTALALRSGTAPQPGDDYEERVLQVLGFLSDSYPQDHPYHPIKVAPVPVHAPEVWLLGTSVGSASLAADLGLSYGFATFPRHESAVDALTRYRAEFTGEGWSPRPRSLLAVGAICAPTEDEAIAIASENDEPPPVIDPSSPGWPNFLVGSVDQVAGRLRDIVHQTGVDELMIITIVQDYAARLRSYELLARAFGLESHSVAANAPTGRPRPVASPPQR